MADAGAVFLWAFGGAVVCGMMCESDLVIFGENDDFFSDIRQR